MKRVLLLNLEDSPENLHLETAFVRGGLRAKGVTLDVLHAFRHEYDFIPRPVNRGGLRLPLGALRRGRVRPRDYHAAVFADIPHRKDPFRDCAELLVHGGFRRKLLLCNHLLPAPDRAKALRTGEGKERVQYALRSGLTRVFDRAYVLSHDDIPVLRPFFKRGALRPRDYALDCRYYSPSPARPGGYVFSAGGAQRDYGLLARALKSLRLRAKIFCDASPELRRAKRAGAPVEVFGLNTNLDRLKPAIGSARMVVVPVKEGAANPCAGMTILFMGMAMGRPVVARDTRETRRFVRDGVNGALYKGGSLDSLRDAMERVGSPGARAMGRAARRTMLRKADLDRLADRVLREARRGA